MKLMLQLAIAPRRETAKSLAIHRKCFGLISDLESRFVCQARGHHGADIRPDFNWDKQPAVEMGSRALV